MVADAGQVLSEAMLRPAKVKVLPQQLLELLNWATPLAMMLSRMVVGPVL
jgi:hypothetical protein